MLLTKTNASSVSKALAKTAFEKFNGQYGFTVFYDKVEETIVVEHFHFGEPSTDLVDALESLGFATSDKGFGSASGQTVEIAFVHGRKAGA